MIPVHLLGFIVLCSIAAGALIVWTARWHGALTGDTALSGIQKVHVGVTPRIGGLSIIAGVLVAAIVLPRGDPSVLFLLELFACSLPVVIFGLAEDLTKRVSPRARLVAAVSSSILAIVVMDLVLPRVGIGFLENAAANMMVAVPLTVLAMSGFTNAINIIDGLNGLASGLVLLMLAATGFVAYYSGDLVVSHASLILAAALVGFMVLNFPRGSIFMGDGGAYLLGFMMVGLWIFMLRRNPEISPWFMVVLGFYPVMETVFSIYRRRFHGLPDKGAMAPDRLHLHSLVYRRWALPIMASSGGMHRRWMPNALAAMAIVCWLAPPALLAVWRPNSNSWNAMLVLACALVYLLVFARFVRFARWRWGGRRRQ